MTTADQTAAEPPATSSTAGPGTIAILLVAQGVSLGFTLANLIIPGSAVFLSAFGSARLPYVYLIVAVAGSVVSMVVNRLQSRFGLQHLAVGATVLVAATVVFAWWLLVDLDAAAAGYLVLTLFAVQLQMGFVFIGAQAGRALDVQRIKSVFPRIVSGFVFGFMVGGFLADPLQSVLGRSEHLLLVGAGAAFAMAGLMAMVGRVMPHDGAEPAGPDGDEVEESLADEKPPPLRALLAVPLVSAVFVYQVLSAMGTQLVDYLVFDRAVARYSGAEELTSFMGGFTAILNLTDLVVLALVGSLIMARYGLRFGVAANPVVVTALLAVALGVSAFFGTGSTALFVLIGIARISDITLADLATRTSVNATFQVLPPQQRLAAQVGVEGVGVPLALGLTAVMILIINALFASPTVPVLIATMLVCVAWCWYSFVVFGRYREGTVLAARRRMLDDVHVDLAEPATRAALVDLARSGNAPDVGAAVDLLVADDALSVDDVLLEAANRSDPAVGHAVLDHLVVRHPSVAAEVAIRSIESSEKRLVIDGLRALGTIGGSEAERQIATAIDHRDQDIRAAAIAAAIISTPSSQEVPTGLLGDLVGSDTAEERVLAARIIGEIGSSEGTDQLLELVVDQEREVRAAAATAAGALPDAAQKAIFQQLVEAGDGPAIGELLRQCSGRAGPETCGSVAHWIGAAHHQLAHRGVRFLVAGRHRLEPDDPILHAAIEAQTARAETAARWSIEVAGSDLTDKQDELARLRRALAAERAQAQRHLIDVLALGYDRDLMGRVGHLWSDRVDGDHAMAREALDLTLADEHRADVLAALADRAVDETEGCSLTAVADLARTTLWAAEPDWLQACAVSLLDATPDDLVAAGPITDEVVRWQQSAHRRRSSGPSSTG